MKPQEFFARNPVFRYSEFIASLDTNGTRSVNTKNALLTHYKKAGKIFQVRRGLYAVVPPGSSPETFTIDPFLLASRLTDNAVIAYHTALQLHERAYSIHDRFLYLSHKDSRDYSFRSLLFQSVRFPKKLLISGKELYGVKSTERQGMEIHVTTLERTLVDLLNRPDLGGGWEEIWRSLESVEFFDIDQVLEYAQLLGNATVNSKVGFYLEQHRDVLMIEDRHLEILSHNRPKKPHYMVRANRVTGRFLERWNLIVPLQVIERSWQEVQ
jgi:predicted transcriptional regulator of viral defense system